MIEKAPLASLQKAGGVSVFHSYPANHFHQASTSTPKGICAAVSLPRHPGRHGVPHVIRGKALKDLHRARGRACRNGHRGVHRGGPSDRVVTGRVLANFYRLLRFSEPWTSNTQSAISSQRDFVPIGSAQGCRRCASLRCRILR